MQSSHIPLDFYSWIVYNSHVYLRMAQGPHWQEPLACNYKYYCHITKFRMCLAQTKLDKSDGSQATIEFFKETLPPQLLQRIYGGETIPEMLTGWYKKAALQEQIR